ncbi:MAG: hypothetical protein ACR65Z_02390 [Methylocystis sp.]
MAIDISALILSLGPKRSLGLTLASRGIASSLHQNLIVQERGHVALPSDHRRDALICIDDSLRTFQFDANWRNISLFCRLRASANAYAVPAPRAGSAAIFSSDGAPRRCDGAGNMYCFETSWRKVDRFEDGGVCFEQSSLSGLR